VRAREARRCVVSVLSRVLDWFDAPRFCPDDGEPIKVENIPSFDDQTGLPRSDRWVWHCPAVRVRWEGGKIIWSQHGMTIHVHGTGQPRWFRAALDGGAS